MRLTKENQTKRNQIIHECCCNKDSTDVDFTTRRDNKRRIKFKIWSIFNSLKQIINRKINHRFLSKCNNFHQKGFEKKTKTKKL